MKQKVQKPSALRQLLAQLKDTQSGVKIPEQLSLRQNSTVWRLSEFYGMSAIRPYPDQEAIWQEVAEQLANQTLGEDTHTT